MVPLSLDVLSQLELRAPATEPEIERVAHLFKGNVPSDYLAFMRISNGAVGRGPELFGGLSPVEELEQINAVAGGVQEDFEGLVLIGGDGCGHHLGIETGALSHSEGTYLWIDPLLPGPEAAGIRAHTLDELLRTLRDYYADLRIN